MTVLCVPCSLGSGQRSGPHLQPLCRWVQHERHSASVAAAPLRRCAIQKRPLRRFAIRLPLTTWRRVIQRDSPLRVGHSNKHICARAARPSGRARCGACAGRSAMKHPSLLTCLGRRGVAAGVHTSTRNPEPETRNPKSCTLHPTPYTLNILHLPLYTS